MSVRDSSSFPFPNVEVAQHQWIVMSDSVRLSARVWFPGSPGASCSSAPSVEIGRFPSVLEYIPYRKNDFTALRDSKRHDYLAGFGFVCVRVDIRGSGDSEGILEDEYLPLELRDACEVIAWIAAQPWSNGSVGMFGKSWGAFNALQVAALSPPALKAVIAVAGTHDRFAEDVHYTGGCVQAMGMLPWASTMLGYNCRPPNAAVFNTDAKAMNEPPATRPDEHDEGHYWRMWRNRLVHTPHFVTPWLSHQTRDEYWRHGSVCEDYSAIRIPVLAVGGWADGYTSFVLQLHNNLSRDVPFAGIIGPWAHQYPEEGCPGPQVAFAQESVMWWRRWLVGTTDSNRPLLQVVDPFIAAWRDPFASGNNSVHNSTARPPLLRSLRLFVIDVARSRIPKWSRSHCSTYSGTWVTAAVDETRYLEMSCFASPDGGRRGLLAFSADEGLTTTRAEPKGASDVVELPPASAARVGESMGSWWGFGERGEAHGDQSMDDDASITFTSRPLETATELIGTPKVRLRVAVNTPTAFVAVRLSVVDIDRSTLVSYGVQNLCIRTAGNSSFYEMIQSNIFLDVSLELRPLAVRVSSGQSLRLAVSQQLWPLIWPSASLPTLRLDAASCVVQLPVSDAALDVIFAASEIETSQPRRTEVLLEPASSRSVIWGADTMTQRHVVVDDSGITRLYEKQEDDEAFVFGACETTEFALGISSTMKKEKNTHTGVEEEEAAGRQVEEIQLEPSVTCDHVLVVSTGMRIHNNAVAVGVGSGQKDLPPFAWIHTSTAMQSCPSGFQVTFRMTVLLSWSLPTCWADVRAAAAAAKDTEESSVSGASAKHLFFTQSGKRSFPRLFV